MHTQPDQTTGHETLTFNTEGLLIDSYEPIAQDDFLSLPQDERLAGSWDVELEVDGEQQHIQLRGLTDFVLRNNGVGEVMHWRSGQPISAFAGLSKHNKTARVAGSLHEPIVSITEVLRNTAPDSSRSKTWFLEWIDAAMGSYGREELYPATMDDGSGGLYTMGDEDRAWDIRNNWTLWVMNTYIPTIMRESADVHPNPAVVTECADYFAQATNSDIREYDLPGALAQFDDTYESHGFVNQKQEHARRALFAVRSLVEAKGHNTQQTKEAASVTSMTRSSGDLFGSRPDR